MIGYSGFIAARNDPNTQVFVSRFYDTPEYTRGGALKSHEIGWTISIRTNGQPWKNAYFHVHWKPKDSEESAVNNNISAHFKESHGSNAKANRNTASLDLKALEAAAMYNGLVLLNANWAPNKVPRGGTSGWTKLDSRITLAMVRAFRNTNNAAALRQLGQNPLYDLNRWDQAAWTEYLGWMTGS